VPNSIKTLQNVPKGDGVNGIPLGLNNNPLNIFSLTVENNEPILRITGEVFAGLSTNNKFCHFIFNQG